MSFKLTERILRWLRLSKPGLGVPEPKALVQRGITHFAEDFPNPAGDDCIPTGVLNALIDSATLPSDEIREHLLTCSPCFTHYRDELARHRAAISSVVGSPFPSFLKTWRVAIAGASIAGILLIASIAFLALKRDTVGRVDGVANGNSNTGTIDNSVRNDRAPASTMPSPETHREDRATKQVSRPLIARNNVDIDLETDNPRRSPADPATPPIGLRKTLNTLSFKLPAGSSKGEYQVSLANPYGRNLKTVKAVSRDGSQLRVDLNLSSVKSGNYLICLGRQTEVPQCVVATVKPTGKKK